MPFGCVLSGRQLRRRRCRWLHFFWLAVVVVVVAVVESIDSTRRDVFFPLFPSPCRPPRRPATDRKLRASHARRVEHTEQAVAGPCCPCCCAHFSASHGGSCSPGSSPHNGVQRCISFQSALLQQHRGSKWRFRSSPDVVVVVVVVTSSAVGSFSTNIDNAVPEPTRSNHILRFHSFGWYHQ